MSKWAVKDMSSGGAFIHNLFLGKIAACIEHSRYTPYHFPHHTAVYGVSNILGGDNRFYNNIFIRDPSDEETTGLSNFWDGAVLMDGVPGWATFMQSPVGISQYDEYPAPDDPPPENPFAPNKLPVYCANNVYFNDAKPYVKEKDAKVCTDSYISVELVDIDSGSFRIKIDNIDMLNNNCKCITTEILGKSYHAEMGYEQPDGSPLCFDSDFFGNKRNKVLAGPFEAEENKVLEIIYKR